MTAHTVYALCDETGFVIYVGCTSNLKHRASSHRRNGVEHSKCVALRVLPTKRDALDVEKALITKLKPSRNTRHKPTPRTAPTISRVRINQAFKPGGEVANHWGANVRVRRRAALLTRTDLARLAGLHPSEVTRIEQSERTPSHTTKCLIAAALRVEVPELFPFPEVEEIKQAVAA